MQTYEDITVLGTVKEAWTNVKGSKAAIWLPTIVFLAVALLGGMLFAEFVSHYEGGVGLYSVVNRLIYILILSVAMSFSIAGITACVLKKTKGERLSKLDVFKNMGSWFQVSIALTIQNVIAMALGGLVGFLYAYTASKLGHSLTKADYVWSEIISTALNIILGAFLLINIALIIDKKYGALKATLYSVLCMRKVFLKAALIYMSTYVAFLIGSLLLGVGVIWAVPFFYLVTVVFYNKVICVNKLP